MNSSEPEVDAVVEGPEIGGNDCYGTESNVVSGDVFELTLVRT